ncbi:MAG: serine/threonine protein kinase, partial [Thermoanaerobaculia bacterium]|nr:serine/threonine protein kinase [Thermoanaerobaculia bacterium]
MGEVFRARDTRLDRDVAVKVLPDGVAGDPKALSRFQAEAKAVAALSHPNILAIFELGEVEGTTFVVTELLEGQTLRSALAQGALPVKRVLDIAISIATGLAAAHEKGIVHRDIKPENVFLTKDGQAKVLDFGLARHETTLRSDEDASTISVLTDVGTVLGTVSYMSP